MSEYQHELDASGLNCPLPILRAKKTIATMNSGEVVKIIATDPGAVKDFEAFCKQTGNELLTSAEASGKFEFQIRKQ
jgi:tRNA 2-thiouridine synthesizing protein A